MLHFYEIGVMKHKLTSEEENARLRGDLLTVACRVNHDLRTPLGGIVTATEALRENLGDHRQSAALTQAIFDSVEEMTRLIRQISIVTRATAHPLPLEPVNLSEVVVAVLQRLESRILKRNATVIEPPSWPQVHGVAAWLEVIWSNFLTNALQHTGDKPRIELTWREENDWLHFGVTDNGGGVPADVRSRLFQPFHLLYQPDNAGGLGLSVVQRLVELQGGRCGYEPLADGSLFFFSLPVKGS